MTTFDDLPAPDRRRAAQILLGFSDDDGYEQVDAVWQESYPVPARMQGLVAALSFELLEQMHETLGEDDTRATLTAWLREALAEESQQNGDRDG